MDPAPSTSVAALLGPDGPVARRMPDFELRPQQLEMAGAIERALAERGRLLVEAGTGVGKSFAYLLPAILRAVETGERVVIATNTISLQEQLIEKDIPLLQACLPHEFSAVLVKGRGNYVSLRRLKLASERQAGLFPDADQRRALHEIEDWAYETDDGSLATLPQIARPDIWDRVQSDADNCMGRRCPYHDDCFFQSARRRMETANLLITNHALYFSDLALRVRGVGFLPEYQHVILDEAHNIEDVACEHFGLSLSEGRVIHLLNTLYSERARRGAATARGFLTTLELRDDDDEPVHRALDALKRCREVSRSFFDQLIRLYESKERDGRGGANQFAGALRLHEPGFIENELTAAMGDLALRLKRLKDLAKKDADEFELNAYAERASSIARESEALVDQLVDGCVYWVDVTDAAARSGRVFRRVSLACSPVEIAPILKEHLFGREPSVILTSATLTTGHDDFSHIQSRLGCDEAETIELGSPFDHGKQVRCIVDPTMPEPNSRDYIDRVCPAILQHVRETDGGAFVLFTSFSMLNRVVERLAPTLADEGLPTLTQGRDGPRGLLLKRFREDDRSVLFGVSSFWQGIDVRGRGLRNVIITRLPFDVPDRPLIEARFDMIRERGGNPFMEDSLPRAIIRFKQGFGRLIRSTSDTGRFVVLDPRIATKFYGRKFLKALPEGIEIERVTPGRDAFA